jgi:predicted nucleic acid-binding protein
MAAATPSLNEFAAVARRKLKMSWEQTSEALLAIRALGESPIPLSIETHKAGLEIASRYGYSIYDALILAAALEADCGPLHRRHAKLPSHRPANNP